MEIAEEASIAVVFVSPGGDYSWVGVVNSVVEHLAAASKPLVVDFSSLDSLSEGFAPGIIERALGVDRPELNFATVPLGKAKREMEIPPDSLQAILQATQSALMSTCKTNRPRGVVSRALRANYLSSSLAIYFAATELLSGIAGSTKVVIPNGRFPQQKAIARAAEDLHLEILFYERGHDDSSYFLNPFMTTSIRARTEVLKKVKSPTQDAMIEAERALENRVSLKDRSNQFSRGWTSQFEIGDLSDTAVYFSSSQDEFWALGDEWEVDCGDQYECLARYLENTPEIRRLIIRMHPNTRDKSVGYVAAEIRSVLKLRRLGKIPIEVIFPQDRANSYLLAAKAKQVLVWNSTIGLESLYLGKDVVFLAPTQYSELLQLSSGILEDAKGSVSKTAVLDYVARCNSLDRPMRSKILGVSPYSIRGRILHSLLAKPPVLWAVLFQGLTARVVVRGMLLLARKVI